MAETGRYRWLTWDRGTYDPRPAWEDGPGGRGVIGTIDGPPAGGISYVVDPSLRRRGYCAAVVGAVLMMPCLEHVELFAAGIGSACAGVGRLSAQGRVRAVERRTGLGGHDLLRLVQVPRGAQMTNVPRPGAALKMPADKRTGRPGRPARTLACRRPWRSPVMRSAPYW